MNNIDFGEIYVRLYKSSFRFVKSYVHDNMAAEDIVSDSLIHFWQTLKKDTINNPDSYWLVILKNRSLNYLKHQRVRFSAIESLSDIQSRNLNYRITALEACDPKEIFSAEISDIIEKTLNTLPKQTRRIFEMSRYNNLSVKEISRELSLSNKSVEYHITKSLKALRIALHEYLSILFALMFFR